MPKAKCLFRGKTPQKGRLVVSYSGSPGRSLMRELGKGGSLLIDTFISTIRKPVFKVPAVLKCLFAAKNELDCHLGASSASNMPFPIWRLNEVPEHVNNVQNATSLLEMDIVDMFWSFNPQHCCLAVVWFCAVLCTMHTQFQF